MDFEVVVMVVVVVVVVIVVEVGKLVLGSNWRRSVAKGKERRDKTMPGQTALHGSRARGEDGL